MTQPPLLPETEPDEVLEQDYVIVAQGPAPADYPFGSTPDEFSIPVFANTFIERRRAFFEFILHNPAPTNVKAPWHELARLAAGGTPHEGIFASALDYIDSRRDSADFPLHAILRLIYQYGEHQRLSPELIERAKASLLAFKYWPDEPGQDSMCTWTESHYILFAAAGYLTAQLYPDEIFTNTDDTGKERLERFRTRLSRWMTLRCFTGFSEWLSNVSYDEDLTALLSLADFARDPEISKQACILIDLLLYEMAVNQFCGVFGSTHGRSYEHTKKWAAQECTTDTLKLLFGSGVFAGVDNMSAAAFALSLRYRMPQVIFDIANDTARPELLHRQRAGIRLDQTEWWDIKPKGMENGMLLLTLEAYLHPRTASLFIEMLDTFDWWDNEFFAPFREHQGLLRSLHRTGMLPVVTHYYEKDVCRNTREEVNIYTYRTPDYLLSSAQDYRKGFGGDQQHIWQATLGPDAVCFTTHPAREHGAPPNYWVGSGCLPRVAQVKNVIVAIYNLEKFPALHISNELFFTHAWLPRDKFEEVVEKDGWIFARLGDGYLALLSENPYQWQEHPGEDQHREILVNARQNIWICELGRAATDGEFTEFMQRILDTQVIFSKNRVTYESPSQGRLEFGWKTPLRREGQVVELNNYPRYASPYGQGAFPLEKFSLEHNQHSLHIDWLECSREASKLIS